MSKDPYSNSWGFWILFIFLWPLAVIGYFLPDNFGEKKESERTDEENDIADHVRNSQRDWENKYKLENGLEKRFGKGFLGNFHSIDEDGKIHPQGMRKQLGHIDDKGNVYDDTGFSEKIIGRVDNSGKFQDIEEDED